MATKKKPAQRLLPGAESSTAIAKRTPQEDRAKAWLVLAGEVRPDAVTRIAAGEIDGRALSQDGVDAFMRALATARMGPGVTRAWFTLRDCMAVRSSLTHLAPSAIMLAVIGSTRDAYWRDKCPDIKTCIEHLSSLAMVAQMPVAPQRVSKEDAMRRWFAVRARWEVEGGWGASERPMMDSRSTAVEIEHDSDAMESIMGGRQ